MRFSDSGGFVEVSKRKSVTQFDITKIVDNSIVELNEHRVKRDIIEDLVHHIVDNNLVHIEEISSIHDNKKTYKGHISVVPYGTKYANVIENVFKIQDEEFTNDELIQAVKNTFPERLV